MLNKNEKIKVIHVVRQFSPAVGGLENFVKSLAVEQTLNGLDVEVVTLNKVFHQEAGICLGSKDVIDGVRVTRIKYIGSYKYPIAFSVLNKIKTADIVHVHAIDFFADYLSFTKYIHKKPLIISTHGGFFHTSYAGTLKKIFFNTITRLSLKSYKAVIACSENDFKQFKPIKEKNLLLIENGVDVDKFKTTPEKKPSKRLAYIGRFSPNKRIDVLLSFFSELVDIDAEYELLIIGKDWQNALCSINEQINQLGISKNVNVLTDLSDDDIKSYLSESSFIVSASDYEGFGLSIIEGMSGGLIPICSEIPSFIKIINDAGIGINIDFNNLKQASFLDDFINKQLSDYVDKVNSSINAASLYGWRIKSLQFNEVYENVLGRNSRVIQGVSIDTRSAVQLIKYLDTKLLENQKTLLAFANAHTINVANIDTEFKSLLHSFLVVNDGIGVQIASKMKYKKGFIENLNGTDFVPKYLSQSKRALNVFLLGATDKTVSKTFNIWKGRYSQHRWCGYHNGFFDRNNCDDVITKINDSGADFLLVAMGNPLQEKWIYDNKDRLNIKLAIGVGALFDFTAGNVVRAPQLLQRYKIEWIYRLLQEPKRLWRRYILGNIIFLWSSFRDK